MYKIELTRTAEKCIKAIPKTAVKRITSKIDSLSRDPHPQGSKKLKSEDLWRVRVGSYRIVYL